MRISILYPSLGLPHITLSNFRVLLWAETAASDSELCPRAGTVALTLRLDDHAVRVTLRRVMGLAPWLDPWLWRRLCRCRRAPASRFSGYHSESLELSHCVWLRRQCQAGTHPRNGSLPTWFGGCHWQGAAGRPAEPRLQVLNCLPACRAPSPAKISQSGVTSRFRTDDNQKARGHILDSSSIRECRTTLHGKPRKLFLLHMCFKKSRFARKWYHRQQSRHKVATAFWFGIHQFSRRLQTWSDQLCKVYRSFSWKMGGNLMVTTGPGGCTQIHNLIDAPILLISIFHQCCFGIVPIPVL